MTIIIDTSFTSFLVQLRFKITNFAIKCNMFVCFEQTDKGLKPFQTHYCFYNYKRVKSMQGGIAAYLMLGLFQKQCFVTMSFYLC